ncbi:MAG: hypothetical protein U9R27_03585 [Campylobacterota bacterium]|nr:hypothetical protein [Campylobacterota bacterium]
MKYVKNILVFIGAGAVVFVVIAMISAFYYATGDRTADHTIVDKKDVRFVLNWSRLGEDRIKSVKHSYISKRSLTGDHIDAYAIEITGLSIDELESQEGIKWTRGDKVDGVFKEAIELASGFTNLDKLAWFPSREQLLSDKIYMNSWATMLHGEQVTSAQLIFAAPSKNMVYYVSVSI